MDNRATTDRTPAGNSGLAKVAVQYSADSFVLCSTFVLRINICGENRHLRQAAKRCTQPYLKIPFTSKFQDIQCENPNHPPHIAAHLQGTQNPPHKANLAKELQLPTHGKQSSIRHINAVS